MFRDSSRYPSIANVDGTAHSTTATHKAMIKNLFLNSFIFFFFFLWGKDLFKEKGPSPTPPSPKPFTKKGVGGCFLVGVEPCCMAFVGACMARPFVWRYTFGFGRAIAPLQRVH
jgi:hypothetical protein